MPAEIARNTGIDFISRTYRIIIGEQPAMLINEKFPVAGQATTQNGSK